MPPASPARRAWGTRYDPLTDPHALNTTAATTAQSLQPDSTSVSQDAKPFPDRDSVRDLFDHVGTERSYPTQHDASTTTSSVAPDRNVADLPPLTRMPHAASVFVASLPSNVSEHELHGYLTEHLSQFATIKHVKIIRDNRSSLCAFVQVESATKAAELISACHGSIFMGRPIRAEAARAFRTLLISLKLPVMSDEKPIPLRLRKFTNSRLIKVTFGQDALIDDPSDLYNCSPLRPDDAFSGPGLYFPEGLKKDNVKGLQDLLKAFGPLESLKPFDPAIYTQQGHYNGSEPSEDRAAPLLAGAGGQSPPSNNAGSDVWAAKWEHRNDAIAAMQTLQYVPNIYSRWEHTSSRPYIHAPGQTDHRLNQGDLDFARDDSRERHGWVQGPRMSPRGQLRCDDHRGQGSRDPATFSDNDFPPLGGDQRELSASRDNSTCGRKNAWSASRSPTFVRSSAPSPNNDLECPDDVAGANEATAPHAREMSDPMPLTPDLISGQGSSPITPACPATPTLLSDSNNAPASQDASFVKEDSEKNQEQLHLTSSNGIQDNVINGCRPDSTHTSLVEKRENALPSKPTVSVVDATRCGGFGPSMYGQFHQFNGAECNGNNGNTVPRPRYQYNRSYIPESGNGGRHDKKIDPKELFVGGLDPETWSEERVRNMFENYGDIQDVRFVKPSPHASHKRAFAFVRFEDEEGPQRAIKEEHMMEYENHPIKVQLRDAGPPRRFQGGGYRGRGHRFSHSHNLGGGGGVDSAPFDRSGTRRLSAPADGNASPRKDIIAELTARETERLAKIQLEGENGEHADHASPLDSNGSVPMDMSSSSAELCLSAGATESPSITLITSPVVSTGHRVTQSEPDISARANSNSPPSNADLASSPASESSPPATASYYGQHHPYPYCMQPNSYGMYSYYPPPNVSGQPVPADGTTPYWMMSMYPRPYFPWFDPPPGVELAPPPITPSGFLQPDTSGILIPVYPSERLGQYMNSPTQGGSANPQQNQASAGSVQPSQAVPTWPTIQGHAPQMYPMPIPIQHAMMVPHLQAHHQQQSQQHQSGLPPSSQVVPPQQPQPQSSIVGSSWNHGQASVMYPPAAQQGGHSVPSAYPTLSASTSTSMPSYPTNPYYGFQIPQGAIHPAQSRPMPYANHLDASGSHTGQHTAAPGKGSGHRRGDPPQRLANGGNRPHFKRPHGLHSANSSQSNADKQQWPKPTSALPVQLTMAAGHWT